MSEHVQGGRLKRMARLAGITARTAKDIVSARAREKLGADAADTAERLTPTATRMVEVLGEMKGAATKLGQFISLTDQDNFPEEARAVLRRLLHQTPETLPWPEVREVIERELGGTPEALFASFEREPFASASMGQVHAATLEDGTDVVVKVQFPGVDKAIESDLRNAATMARSLALAGGVLDGREYYEEIAATLRRELDYREEVAQLRDFAAAVSPWPSLVVPRAFDERSSQRVLTLERLRGPTLLSFAESEEASAAARHQAATLLATAIIGPFLRQGLVHADPHPGNYIVIPGEGGLHGDGTGMRLGVLDFGATRQISADFVGAYWRLIEACLADDRYPALLALDQSGFELPPDRDKASAWVEGLADIVEEPIRQRHYDWGACELSTRCRDHVYTDLKTAVRVRSPVEGVMFYRAILGLHGDLRLLRSSGDYRRVVEDMTRVAAAHIEAGVRSAAPEVFDRLESA